MKKTDKLISARTKLSSKGITAQENKAKVKVIKGENKKIIKLEGYGIIVSFANNFKPSAIGCNKPQRPTTLGPLRRCIDANNLRS
jgi:hypothetical protein